MPNSFIFQIIFEHRFACRTCRSLLLNLRLAPEQFKLHDRLLAGQFAHGTKLVFHAADLRKQISRQRISGDISLRYFLIGQTHRDFVFESRRGHIRPTPRSAPAIFLRALTSGAWRCESIGYTQGRRYRPAPRFRRFA